MCLKGADLSVRAEFQEDTEMSFGKKKMEKAVIEFWTEQRVLKILSFYLHCFFQEVFV